MHIFLTISLFLFALFKVIAQDTSAVPCHALVDQKKYAEAKVCYEDALKNTKDRNRRMMIHERLKYVDYVITVQLITPRIKTADSLIATGNHEKAFAEYFYCLRICPEQQYYLDRILLIDQKTFDKFDETKKAVYLNRTFYIQDSLLKAGCYNSSRMFYKIYLEHSFAKEETEAKLKTLDLVIDSLKYRKAYPEFEQDGSFTIERVYFKNKSFKFTRKNREGKLINDGYLINGMYDSTWTQYHIKEQTVHYIHHWTEGMMHGPEYGYYPDGKKQSEGTLWLGHMNGRFRYWYANGTLMQEATYVNDTLHGEYVEYYENGYQKTKITYENGIIEGIYKSWFIDGKTERISTYKGGELNGLEVEYYPTGSVKHKINFSHGHAASRKDYRENGDEYNIYEKMY